MNKRQADTLVIVLTMSLAVLVWAGFLFYYTGSR